MASLPASAFLGALLSLIIYIAYRTCRPHPIPGIPYNKDSANRLLGDLPRVKQYARETGEKLSWFALEAQKMGTPIFQVFIKPLSKPWVVVTDSRESYDILLRRTKEFDRSDTFGNIFRGLVPDHHISMKSVNPEFKAHRRLIQDLMTPQFLNEVRTERKPPRGRIPPQTNPVNRSQHRDYTTHSRLSSTCGPKRRAWLKAAPSSQAMTSSPQR